MSTSLRRVVLDTNVVLSALLFPNGHLSIIREAWWAGRFNPLINQVTVSELLRVLSYPKFRLSMPEKEELLSDYVPYCEVVQKGSGICDIPECRDPMDVPFLELAATGNADLLVSGDKDLLALREQVRFDVLAPGEFISRILKIHS
nr:putative toxin-antitoxin system toxin component, PIN family [Acidithiobacillus sulfurivorans]